MVTGEGARGPGAPVLFSILESPGHPNLSDLYRRLGLAEVRLPSQRKAVQALKRQPPDFVVAEFFYGFGNNYAGANLSNLDVFLASLQKYAAHARVIVLVDKAQRKYVDKLAERFPLHAVLVQPVRAADIEPFLSPNPS
jgi:AmiR/NasT family two-component response regulator